MCCFQAAFKAADRWSGNSAEKSIANAQSKIQRLSGVFDKARGPRCVSGMHLPPPCLIQVPLFRNADRGRLLMSFAESSLLRNAARPVTVPLKIAMAAQLVLWAKQLS